LLYNGTFVSFATDAHENAPHKIGRIVLAGSDDDGTRYIYVNVFNSLSDYSVPNEDQCRPIATGACQGLPELVQTKEFVTIAEDDILDLAFVFSPQNVSSGEADAVGITNCFLCRFRISPVANIVETVVIVPFPSYYDGSPVSFGCCFPSKIWKWTSVLQDMIRTGLNRSSENQGSYVKYGPAKQPFCSESWEYLSQKMVEGRIVILETTSRNIRRRTLNGMLVESLQVKRPSIFYRFETKHQLNVLRSIVGRYVTVGMRLRRPKVGKPR
jgi:hypothetical protein